MAKLVTEKERGGSKDLSQKWGKRLKFVPDYEYDDEPTRVKMSRHSIPTKLGGGKRLSDVLNPLKGYLKKNVGRPWDDVYSEIAANLDRRSVSGIHIFSHLWDYVELNCWIGAETGTVYSQSKYGYSSTPSYFYVHPWTGILCKAPEWRTSRKKRRKEILANKPVDNISVGLGKSVQLIDGIWYYISQKLVTHKVERFDREGEPYIHIYQAWEPEHKLQLNKKELKRMKIKNVVIKQTKTTTSGSCA